MIKTTYSIGEVATMFSLPISTIRYYDKEGLIPNLQKNTAGIRIFSQENLDTITIIECLKKAGMPIKDIKTFIQWCEMGDSTLDKRLQMFQELRVSIEKQKEELQNTLDTINYKCNYYTQAVKDGTKFYVKTNSKHS